MADLVITSTDVQAISGSTITQDAEVPIVAGKLVYSVDSKWQLLNASISATPYLTLNDGAASQPITAINTGVVDIGVLMTQGMPLFVSPNSGFISDAIADIIAPNYVTIIGYPDVTINQIILSPYIITNPRV
jgi:hypothetical protein